MDILNNSVEIKQEMYDTEIQNFNINENSRYSNLVINENLSGASGSATYSFSVTKSQPYYRVYIENTGTSSIKAKIGENIYTISKGTSITKSFKANTFGRRNIDITSTDGSALSGRIAVRVVSEESEVN